MGLFEALKARDEDPRLRTGWFAEELPPCAPLEGERRVDVAVIGGGFSGLSTAYHLKRRSPDLDVALVEAAEVGGGASGRSGGILSTGIGTLYTIRILRSRYGDDGARRIYMATRQAVADVVEVIRREALAVDLEDTGHLRVAPSPSLASSLRLQSQAYEDLGIDGITFLDQGELAEYLRRDTPTWYAAAHFPESVQLNPVKLCQEWRRQLLKMEVQVFEGSPVVELVEGQPQRVVTPGGALLAREVVVATNVYAPWLRVKRGQIFPMHTYALVTPPLTDAQRQRIHWGRGEPVMDTRNFFNYHRFGPRGELFFGGGAVSYARDPADWLAGQPEVADARCLDELEAAFRRSFPELAEVPVAHGWGGPIAFSFDTLPIVGPTGPGQWYLGGWGGHGIAISNATGRVVADMILEGFEARERLPWLRRSCLPVPGDPLRGLALAGMFRGVRFLDSKADRWLHPQAAPAQIPPPGAGHAPGLLPGPEASQGSHPDPGSAMSNAHPSTSPRGAPDRLEPAASERPALAVAPPPEEKALGRRTHEEHVVGGPNCHRYWYKIRDPVDGPVLGPLRILFNYLVIYGAKHLPSLTLKRWIFRMMGMKLGENVTIASGVTLDYFYPELIEIDDNTIVGMDSMILTHEFFHDRYRLGRVKIGRDCMIGAQSLILAGVHVGDGVMVSAKTLVHRSVPGGTFVAGVPAAIVPRRQDGELAHG